MSPLLLLLSINVFFLNTCYPENVQFCKLIQSYEVNKTMRALHTLLHLEFFLRCVVAKHCYLLENLYGYQLKKCCQ